MYRLITCGMKENHSPPAFSLGGLGNFWPTLSPFAGETAYACTSFSSRINWISINGLLA